MKIKNEVAVLGAMALLVVTGHLMAEEIDAASFEFPNDNVGVFAKSWYAAVNSGDERGLDQYMQDDSWREHLSLIINLAEKVGGFSPALLSYKTDEYIGIYSTKDNGQSWVRVMLGLSPDGEILEMGIRKRARPVDYPLRLNLTSEQAQSIVLSVVEEIRNNYVTRDRREIISQELLTRMENGAYNDITQGDFLANVLTKDLLAIANDKHLEVIAPSGIIGVQSRFGLGDGTDGVETHEDSTQGMPISGNVVDNNIGYIVFERFVDSERVEEETRTILFNLKDCEAIVIDLTTSGGGDAEAAINFLSYFFPDPVLLGGSADVSDGPGAAEWTRPHDLSKPLSTVPLYVLTSSKTPSAAEMIVYQLKRNGRATIVGETTAGAGNRVNVFGLAHDFYLVNSIANPYNTDENSGWERIGIQPDIEVASREAFERTMSLISAR